MTRRLGLTLLSAASLLVACGPTTSDEAGGGGGDVSFHATWLTRDPSAAIPDGVSRVRLSLYEGRSPDFSVETELSFSASLPLDGEDDDPDGDGRPEVVFDSLPTRAPFHIVVEGLDSAGQVAFLGHVGPIILGPGERRFVDLVMYPVGDSAGDRGELELPGVEGLVMPEVIALRDGRVLVAGGFETIDNEAACPADVPEGTTCMMLGATDAAFVFDVSTATFHPIAGGMLQARGGHTATPLPDGRVLVAGGAEQALLLLVPAGPTDSPTSVRRPELRPMTADGEPAAHATFEIFDPNRGAETSDPERDGDPDRGAFVGSALDPEQPAALNQQRFMHAATPVPGRAERVLLVGGSGLDGAAQSWEVYDDRRPGGYGVYDNTGNALQLPRSMPGALTFDDDGSAWILGGAIATGNVDLAEVWTPDPADPEAPNGMTTAASELKAFPNPTADDEVERPQFALLHPAAITLPEGTHGLVLGSLGPRCNPDGSGPVFASSADGAGTVMCPFEGSTGSNRSFTVGAEAGTAAPTDILGPRSFMATATLDNGNVAVAGGVGRADWNGSQNTIELYSGAVGSDNAAELRDVRIGLLSGRAMPGAAPLPNRGLIVIGGARIQTAGRFSALPTAEVIYLPR